MENWGLVLYRETVLLYNEATDPVGSKQQVAVVIAHELAHQVKLYSLESCMQALCGKCIQQGYIRY